MYTSPGKEAATGAVLRAPSSVSMTTVLSWACGQATAFSYASRPRRGSCQASPACGPVAIRAHARPPETSSPFM